MNIIFFMYKKLIRLLNQRSLTTFFAKQNHKFVGIFLAFSCLTAAYALADESGAINENDGEEIIEHSLIEPDDLPEIGKMAEFEYQQGITTFSIEVLQKRLSESETENQLVSPLGISFLLSMIKHAVGPEDQMEIERIIHLPQDETELQVSAFRLIKKLMKNGVDIAGLLYLNPQYRLNPNYQMLASQYYQSKVESGSSAKRVNAWAQQVTNGQIKKIVEQGDLKNFFVLLANAIHFKADWSVPFKSRDTYVDNFVTPIQVIQTEMMHKTDRVEYFEDENCQAIRLTYKGNTCSMLLILPKADNDFSFINESSLLSVFQGLQTEKVKIALPIFNLEQDVDVKQMLKDMGLIHLFDKPDFSPLVDLNHGLSRIALPKLSITQMKQNVALACDEKGTEASAVTSAIIGVTSAGVRKEKVKDINFNRPFLVLLTTPETPILFGVIRDPSH